VELVDSLDDSDYDSAGEFKWQLLDGEESDEDVLSLEQLRAEVHSHGARQRAKPYQPASPAADSFGGGRPRQRPPPTPLSSDAVDALKERRRTFILRMSRELSRVRAEQQRSPSPPASPAPAAADSSDEEQVHPPRQRLPPQLPSNKRAEKAAASRSSGFTSPPISMEPPWVGGSQKRGKQSMGGGNSGEVPFKEPAVGTSERPRRGGIAGAADQLRERAEAEAQRLKEAARRQQEIEAKVAPFDGHCWWCFCKCASGEQMHDPDAASGPFKCPSRGEVSMVDWDEPVSRVTKRLSKAISDGAVFK